MQQVEKAVESMMQDIHRDLLQPMQKEAFLCCARCCDTSDGMQQLQNWCACSVRPAGAVAAILDPK